MYLWDLYNSINNKMTLNEYIQRKREKILKRAQNTKSSIFRILCGSGMSDVKIINMRMQL